MRGSLNLFDIDLKIDDKIGKVESFWITETKDIYVKVNVEDATVNYRLSDLKDLIQDQPKFKFETDLSPEYIQDKIQQN